MGMAGRRRLRALGAAGSLLVLAVGLVLVATIAGGASRALANVAGVSPQVFVTGAGGADHFTLASVNPTSIGNVQPGTVLGPVAINTTATKALVGVAGAPGTATGLLDLVVNNKVTGSSIQLSGAVIGIAMDPTNQNLAYVLVSSGTIYAVDISGTKPAPTQLTVQFGGDSLAISPNGQTLYVGSGNGDGTCALNAIPVAPPHTSTTLYNCPSQEGRNVVDVAVSPDGDQVFGAVQLFTTSAVVALGVHPWTQPLTGEEPTTLTVAPDGNTVYAGMHDIGTEGSTGSVIQARRASDGALLGSTPVAISTNANQQGGVTGIAVSPDGDTMIAAGYTPNPITGASQTVVVPVDLQLPLTPRPATVVAGLSTTGPQNVAITPDQAPVASFSTIPAVQVGQSVPFNANPSTVAYGAVSTFAWTFGDGHTGSGLNVSHSYTAPGTYTVILTETDSAGTSVPPAVPGTGFGVDGPGQTPYRRADPSAQVSGTVTVTATTTPTTPPTTPTTPTSTSTTPTTAPSTATTPTTTPGQPAVRVPTLVLNPALGPPGTIVTVTGTGFQPNSPVTVAWSISTGSVVIVADAQGRLPPSQLLILTPDVLGPRFAQASSTPQAAAPFLVVPSDSEPGGDNAGLLFRSEGP